MLLITDDAVLGDTVITKHSSIQQVASDFWDSSAIGALFQ